jgi:YHS domain-containing protein
MRKHIGFVLPHGKMISKTNIEREKDMKLKMTVITLAALLAAGLIVRAEEKAAAPKDTYPLKTCVVSDEDLGDMGDLVKYTYKSQDGKEREVRFCCRKCIKKFEKDPATYLKKLDEAEAKAKQAGAAK